MKILIDENMPYAQTLFSRLGHVTRVQGRAVSEIDLFDADALIVRSTTKVNSTLLTKTPVKFVGTATAGFDHIDTIWLAEENIGFSFAPGCNAIAVVEYVLSALLMLAERDSFDLRDKTVGIIGVGNVGSCLADRLSSWGVKTLLCDPIRAKKGDQENFLLLDNLLPEADVLTFHTPLSMEGFAKTFHLMNINRLENLRDRTILINTSRGEVVDNKALLSVLKQGKKLSVVLDVWELEPNLSIELLQYVDIATPHIAGYTLEGRARGTIQVYTDYCNFLRKEDSITLSAFLPSSRISTITVQGKLSQSQLNKLIHLVYDVRYDDAALRKVAAIPGEFDKLRKCYQERREWSFFNIHCDNEYMATQLSLLGFHAYFIK
ncbi:Erythronate-4-phosphate dehydrogenase [Candidatus Hartigia pinicola]|nr:Erythronate-4-phosphate dehydrogenase [Candidatus Hartigia pinicola]